jgi:hypothetical protein
MHTLFWSEYQKEIEHYEDLDVDVRIMIKWTLETKYGVVWIGFIWLRIGTRVSCEHGNER